MMVGITSTIIMRMVIISMIITRITPSVTIMPTPTPVVPAIIAMTVIRSIPSVPWIIPRIVPSVAIIPIPRINKNNSMITT